MTTNPLCPYCGNELWYEHQLEEDYDGEYRDEKWRGYCDACSKTFTWWEKYKRINYDELEEVSED